MNKWFWLEWGTIIGIAYLFVGYVFHVIYVYERVKDSAHPETLTKELGKYMVLDMILWPIGLVSEAIEWIASLKNTTFFNTVFPAVMETVLNIFNLPIALMLKMHKNKEETKE